MYRINDRSSAIKSVQRYLRVVGNPEIFVAPTGVFDDNTRLSVIDFQEKNNVEPSGIVDRITFDLLFLAFTLHNEKNRIREGYDSFISFPLIPGAFHPAMIHINRTLARLLNHYRKHHSLRESNFYSKSTSEAVKLMREIYLLGDVDMIDEELYGRMVTDHDSINDLDNNLI